MRVTTIDREEFSTAWAGDMDRLRRHLDEPAVLIVKDYVDRSDVRALRDHCFSAGERSDPTWQPLLDGCTDYHRVHDNYPKAHVKARMHAWYFHGYCDDNRVLFDRFDEVFRLKWRLAERDGFPVLDSQPSDGLVARVLVHHYPSGGGYQAEHIDPVFDLARVQTLLMASDIGTDFTSGGLYALGPATKKRHYLDDHARAGDLVMLSPDIRHGVAEVDEDETAYRLHENNGRWVVMPIFVPSDYPENAAPKPVQVA